LFKKKVFVARNLTINELLGGAIVELGSNLQLSKINTK